VAGPANRLLAFIALRPSKGDACWLGARVILSSLLFTAAWTKYRTLTNDATWGNHVWDQRWFLAALAIVESGCALWLVFGLYPRRTYFSAVTIFAIFGLFNTYLASTGAVSCPCFDRASDPTWMALLDALIVLALVLCPAPNAEKPTFSSSPWRLYGFCLASVFVMAPAAVNMGYYAHTEVALDLRLDGRLYKKVKAQLQSPSSEQLLQQLSRSTGLEFTLDNRLGEAPPNYGVWGSLNAWSVMLVMAKKQTIPARWDRTETGYHLAVAAPWGGRAVPWVVSGAVFACVCLAFGYMTGKFAFVWRLL
jgi:Methylamine utilisation protein MauE